MTEKKRNNLRAIEKKISKAHTLVLGSIMSSFFIFQEDETPKFLEQYRSQGLPTEEYPRALAQHLSKLWKKVHHKYENVKIEVEEVPHESDQILESIGLTQADIICGICQDLFVEPIILNKCCHRFCKSCLQEAMKNSKMCPICRQYFDREVIDNRSDPILVSILNQLGKSNVEYQQRLRDAKKSKVVQKLTSWYWTGRERCELSQAISDMVRSIMTEFLNSPKYTSTIFNPAMLIEKCQESVRFVYGFEIGDLVYPHVQEVLDDQSDWKIYHFTDRTFLVNNKFIDNMLEYGGFQELCWAFSLYLELTRQPNPDHNAISGIITKIDQLISEQDPNQIAFRRFDHNLWQQTVAHSSHVVERYFDELYLCLEKQAKLYPQFAEQI